MLIPLALAFLLAVTAQAPGECDYEDTRAVQLTGARSLLIATESGELRVEGRSGVDDVRVEARLCASSQELLSEMRLETGVTDGRANIRTDLPEDHRNNSYARMDLLVIVPQGMPADIEDGSGATWLSHLGAAHVIDGSGQLEIADLHGPLDLQDGSGSVEITNVTGNVIIDDASGELSLRNVEGTIAIDDGSGSIDVVDGGALSIDDGSGSIDVHGIGGDFTVDDDGSGSIRYDDVAGTVRIPQDKRRRDG